MYNRIKELCSEKGITMSYLEKEAGLSKGTLTYWKVAKNPAMSSVSKVAEILGVTPDYLFTGTDRKMPELTEETATLSVGLLTDKVALDTFKMFMQLSDSRKEDIFDIVKMFYEKEK